ncbi:MAG TPA: c-type cytochrome [Anaeromyxobacteraceae bacterium]
MSRRSLAVLVALATALSIAAAGSALLIRGGASAKGDPSRLEAAVARRARSLLIPASARDLANPLAATPEVVAEGRAHFADHCALCHANDGGGATALGRGLYPRAPDLRRPEAQRLTDGEIFWIIENGVRFTGMPAMGEPGRESESWAMVHFIRRLPALTPEEKLQMERMNPRGPQAWRELEEDERFLRGKQPASAAPGHRH